MRDEPPSEPKMYSRYTIYNVQQKMKVNFMVRKFWYLYYVSGLMVCIAHVSLFNVIVDTIYVNHSITRTDDWWSLMIRSNRSSIFHAYIKMQQNNGGTSKETNTIMWNKTFASMSGLFVIAAIMLAI